jgi:hypothetical protein
LNGRGKSGTTGKPERLESQNDRKTRTTEKPERPESQNDRKARTTGKPEPTMKAGTTRKSGTIGLFQNVVLIKKSILILSVAIEAFARPCNNIC